jgi:hypothetical protein
MLAIVSPAKKIDGSAMSRPLPHTVADFARDAQGLAATLRKLGKTRMQQMMKISDKLAELNFQRYQDFASRETPSNAKQAVLTFAGDTYVGLDANTLSDNELDYAQDHLRILSGLYGVLRPLDLIQPYRLEMGSRLITDSGGDLYDYWGGRLGDALDADVADHPSPVLINLASIEYFKAVRAKTRRARIITPIFKEEKNGVAKVLGMFAKRARGSMARYIIGNRIENVEDLKGFDTGGYEFRPHVSDDENWVFIRKS